MVMQGCRRGRGDSRDVIRQVANAFRVASVNERTVNLFPPASPVSKLYTFLWKCALFSVAPEARNGSRVGCSEELGMFFVAAHARQ